MAHPTEKGLPLLARNFDQTWRSMYQFRTHAIRKKSRITGEPLAPTIRCKGKQSGGKLRQIQNEIKDVQKIILKKKRAPDVGEDFRLDPISNETWLCLAPWFFFYRKAYQSSLYILYNIYPCDPKFCLTNFQGHVPSLCAGPKVLYCVCIYLGQREPRTHGVFFCRRRNFCKTSAADKPEVPWSGLHCSKPIPVTHDELRDGGGNAE